MGSWVKGDGEIFSKNIDIHDQKSELKVRITKNILKKINASSSHK